MNSRMSRSYSRVSLNSLPPDKVNEEARARFIAETTDWLRDCAKQGRFIPLACADRRAFRSLLERWSSRLREQGFRVEGIEFWPNSIRAPETSLPEIVRIPGWIRTRKAGAAGSSGEKD